MDSDNTGTPAGQVNSNGRRTQDIQRLGAIVAAGLFGCVTGAAILLAIAAARNQERLPRLDVEEFAEFQDKWRAAQVKDYRITIEVTGRQAAEYSVEVRDGQVVSATRDGEPLRQRRTFTTWSVPGMFTTIQSDVNNLIKHREGTADRLTPQVLLRAKFHPELGYPERYHRTELQKWGTNPEVFWKVTVFQEFDAG